MRQTIHIHNGELSRTDFIAALLHNTEYSVIVCELTHDGSDHVVHAILKSAERADGTGVRFDAVFSIEGRGKEFVKRLLVDAWRLEGTDTPS